jgi:hypothetical protein
VENQKNEEVDTTLPKIYKQDFVLWQENLVTKHLLQHFSKIKDYVKESRLNPELIKSKEGVYRANYLLGYYEALEELLDFTIEEEIEDEG